MPRYKITVAYDGTGFVGWQRQANGVSIQGLIEEAAGALDNAAVTVVGAGRTDAGVHAVGQVAALTLRRTLPPDGVMRALNARLPATIRIIRAEEVAPGFHPRYGARRKMYRYRIWNGDVVSPFEHGYAWHISKRLAIDAMRAAARLLEGRHDFAAFQSAGSDVATTTREIFASRIADCGLRPDCRLQADCGLRSDCGLPMDGELRDESPSSGGGVVSGNSGP